MLLVLDARVLRLRHRHRAGQLREVVEATERLLQVEHDRQVVRGLDRRVRVDALGLVRALVALRQRQRVTEVRRAVDQHALVDGAQHGVLDVLGRDRRAVLVLEVRSQLVRPGLAVVARGAQALGQVTDELLAALAGNRLPRRQAPAIDPQEVPGKAVVRVAGVDRVPVLRDGHLQGATGLVGRAVHLVDRGVEGRCRIVVVVVRVVVVRAATAGGKAEGERGAHDDRGHRPLPHWKLLFVVDVVSGKARAVFTAPSDRARRAARRRRG